MKKAKLVPFVLLLCLGTVLAVEQPVPLRLDLGTVIQLALTADTQVLTATVGVASTEARVKQELAKIAPGCAISMDYAQSSGGSGTSRTWGVTFTIAQNRPGLLPLTIARKAAGAVEQALWDRADAESRLVQARVVATAGATQRYLAAVVAEKVLALRKSALSLAEEDERIARACLEAGMVIPLDVKRAESNREKAALDLAEANAGLRNALDTLLLQLGKPLGLEVELAPVSLVPPAETPPLEELTAQALQTRPEVLAARTGLRKAEASLVQAENTSLPDLKLSATERWDECQLSVMLDLTTGDVRWSLGGEWGGSSPAPPVTTPKADGLSLGLTLDWNPFDGGASKALVAAAQAGLESARISLGRTEGEIRLELRRLAGDLRLAGLRLSQAKKDREIAAEARRLAALRYQEGIALFSELGQATQALAQAEFTVVQREYDLLMAWIKLEEACGRMGAS